VYVSNTHDDTVSVINSTVFPLKLVKNVTVNPNMNPSIEIPSPLPAIMRFPNIASFVAVNEDNNMIYVSNTGSNTISQLNGTENNLVLGIQFTIEPENLGDVFCDGKRYQNGDYIRYPNNMSITCEARAKSIFPVPSFGFLSIFPPILFDYWSSDQNPPISNNHVTTFIVNDPGAIRAYFEELPDFFQLMAVAFAVLTGIAAALYSKREWINKRRYLGRYLKKIDAAYEISNRRKGESLELLGEIKKISRDLFIQNKLTESDYFEIDKKIEEYRNKISRTGD